MPLPTEPVGSLPRPSTLQTAIAGYDAGTTSREELEREQEAACKDSIERMEATGSPIVSDGEQRASSFATDPLADTLAGTGLADNLAGDGQYFAIFDDGHHRQLPRLTGGPFAYKTFASDYLAKSLRLATKPMKQAVIAPSMLMLLYPLEGEIEGYPREQFLSDLVDECEKDIRQAFATGATRVSIDFTEGRLANKNDPRNPWTGRNMLQEFIDLNNRVLDRFSAEERVNIGIHTCPGGDCDSVHSAEVDYAELLPSMFQMNAGYFLIQLASEKDRERVYKLVGEQSRGRQRRPSGRLRRRDQPARPQGRDGRGGARPAAAGRQVHPEGAAGLDRRLRLLTLQHRRQAQARLARLRPRRGLPEDHGPGRGHQDGIGTARDLTRLGGFSTR